LNSAGVLATDKDVKASNLYSQPSIDIRVVLNQPVEHATSYIEVSGDQSTL
jgi:hypothetical protein